MKSEHSAKVASNPNQTGQPLRVVHLPTSVGGNPQGLSQSLRALGLDSESWIFLQNYFAYASTRTIWNPGDGLFKREWKRWRAIAQVARRSDVIHFNYGSGWAYPIPMFSSADKTLKARLWRLVTSTYLHALCLLELNVYRLLRRPMFAHYQGDDARQGAASLTRFRHSIAQYVEVGYYSPEGDALKQRMIRRMAKYCDQVYAVNPDLLHVLGPGARFVPYSHIFLDDWVPVYTQTQNRPLRIGHAPSNRKVKGTDFILATLNELAAEGLEFELVLVEGLSHEAARRQYEQIDLLIDQVHAGWYGGLAVEVMALGKPVMAYIREEDLDFIPREMRAELPILKITLETLKYDLRMAITMPREQLLALAHRSRAYVERWHDPIRIANEIRGDYLRALQARNRA